MIRLGLIGISEGNGHPYSWSAIINGYVKELIEECPYKVIPNYLAKYSSPENKFISAMVTHIWTQDLNISQDISKSCYIPEVVNHFEDMIGHIDGLLLARDDYENHLFYAKAFLNAGIPVFIDKPIATSSLSLRKLMTYQKYSGQIFSCSALRFSNKLREGLKQFSLEFGEIITVKGNYTKNWDKYSVHVIDPIIFHLIKRYLFLNELDTSKKTINFSLDNKINVKISKQDDLNTLSEILLIGEKGELKIYLDDYYHSFKEALLHFVNIIDKKTYYVDDKITENIVRVIEFGMREFNK